MNAQSEIKKLIERFDQQREAYLSDHYKEAELRQHFINPFCEALGWDISNTGGYAEAYRDVIHEDAIKIGGVFVDMENPTGFTASVDFKQRASRLPGSAAAAASNVGRFAAAGEFLCGLSAGCRPAIHRTDPDPRAQFRKSVTASG